MLQLQIILGGYLLSIIASVVFYLKGYKKLAYGLKNASNAMILSIILYILAWLAF